MSDDDPFGEWAFFEVRARQGEMASGRSFARNMLGMSTVRKCYFDIWDAQGIVKQAIFGVEFLVDISASSLEHLSGMDRTVAEDALRDLDDAMQEKGCRRIADGPHWYSHRYTIHEDYLDNFNTPPSKWRR